MPGFLTSLLVLVSSFILGGKPIDTPAHIPSDVSLRGFEASELATKELTVFSSPNIEQKHQGNSNESGKPTPSNQSQILPNGQRQMGGSVLPPDQNITPVAGSGQASIASTGVGIVTDTSNQTPDNTPHDRSLGIYDGPSSVEGSTPEGYVESGGAETPAPNTDNYQPLEREFPGGIMTVYENNPQNITPKSY